MGGMNFIDLYLEYKKHTEPQYICHRWSAIGILAATLGRKVWFPFGDARIFPNLYIMIIGEPAARKSTAIKTASGLLSETGYSTFAADKTRQEKFLMDLAGVDENGNTTNAHSATGLNGYDSITLENLWGGSVSRGSPKEVFIAADEFSDFTPPGSGEFYTLLGNLWDYDKPQQPYTHRLKNSASLEIYQPTVNMLAGITPELFAKMFPPDIIGTGFLSRMIMIHVERSGRKYTIPPRGDEVLKASLLEKLQEMQASVIGELVYSDKAYNILERIYTTWEQLDDIRFRSYSSRRFTQLLKLCIIISAAYGVRSIDERSVITANTYLTAAERLMPQALGEFGNNKYSKAQHMIMELLGSASKPMDVQTLWSHLPNELNKISELGDIMQNLKLANKVQLVAGGFLLNKVVKKEVDYVDWSLLSTEEREGWV